MVPIIIPISANNILGALILKFNIVKIKYFIIKN